LFLGIDRSSVKKDENVINNQLMMLAEATVTFNAGEDP